MQPSLLAGGGVSRCFGKRALNVVIVVEALDPAILGHHHRYTACGDSFAYEVPNWGIAGECGRPCPFSRNDWASPDDRSEAPIHIRLALDHHAQAVLDLRRSLTPESPRDVFMDRVRSQQRFKG